MSPEVERLIHSLVSLLVSDETGARFLDLRYAIDKIKREDPPWQAAASIGVHAAVLHVYGREDGERTLLRDLVGSALEPVEALHSSLLSETRDHPGNVRGRLLFHVRFALGFLALAAGQLDCARKIVHEMAATKLSRRGSTYRSDPGVLEATSDIEHGKLVAALLMLPVYGAKEADLEEALFLLTQARACNPLRTDSLELAMLRLDLWASCCEMGYPLSDDDDSFLPDPGWLDVLAATTDLLSLCEETDASADSPEKCKRGSAQFVAWKFGQLVGRFTLACVRRQPEVFGVPVDFFRFCREVEDVYTAERRQEIYRSLVAASALVAEYDPDRDWMTLRKRYLQMWLATYCSPGAPFSEIGPESDLHWAARIGFADRMLEEAGQAALAERSATLQPLVQNIAETVSTTKEMVTAIGLRELKAHLGMYEALQKLLDRSEPTKSELRLFVHQHLGAVVADLPAKVENKLVKAEKNYWTEVDDDTAKVCFAEAVEAGIADCLVEPLVRHMQARKLQIIAIPFVEPKGVQKKTISAVERMTLSDWADVLDRLTMPAQKDLASLGDFWQFMSEHLGGPRLPDFRQLAQSLGRVQQLRGGSAHHQSARSRSRERLELENLRRLALGIGCESVIAQVYRLLAPRTQRARESGDAG